MPRYFFNIHDGIELDDPSGSDLPDLASAFEEARIIARKLLADGMLGGLDRRRWSVRIIDEAGEILGSLPFTEPAETDGRQSSSPSKVYGDHSTGA